MALLQVLLPATLAHGIGDRVRQQARAIRDAAIAERARRVVETAAPEKSPSAADEMPAEATIAHTVVADQAGPQTATAYRDLDNTRTLTQRRKQEQRVGEGGVAEE